MKYIAYCRKSTDEKDKQVLSIEAQIAELREFAKRDSLEIVEFIMEAKTAKTPGREQFAEVLKKIEKGHAQGILSWHPFMSIPHFFSIRLVSLPVFLRT